MARVSVGQTQRLSDSAEHSQASSLLEPTCQIIGAELLRCMENQPCARPAEAPAEPRCSYV